MPAHRTDRGRTRTPLQTHSSNSEDSTPASRNVLAIAVVIALVATLGYALHTEEPSRRKLLGHVVALQLYADLDRPPTSLSIAPEADTSLAAPGRPGGYRRAVKFHDPRLPCAENAPPVDCGAKLEIFRRRSTAVERAAKLADDPNETVVRRGALVLRLSRELSIARRQEYEDAFVAAVTDLYSFRELARLDQAAAQSTCRACTSNRDPDRRPLTSERSRRRSPRATPGVS